MLSSNAQWARDVEHAEPGFFEKMARGQSPQVLWIGCADSRVPESVVLARRPGEIFVTRNIANQFPPHDDSANSVVNYAVETLGVQHVVVVGHTNCGGAAACYDIATGSGHSPPPDSALGRWLGPLVDLAKSVAERSVGGDKTRALVELVEENVRKQVENVRMCATIQGAWKAGKDVWVHGWVFELETGKLRDLVTSYGPPGAR